MKHYFVLKTQVCLILLLDFQVLIFMQEVIERLEFSKQKKYFRVLKICLKYKNKNILRVDPQSNCLKKNLTQVIQFL